MESSNVIFFLFFLVVNRFIFFFYARTLLEAHAKRKTYFQDSLWFSASYTAEIVRLRSGTRIETLHLNAVKENIQAQDDETDRERAREKHSVPFSFHTLTFAQTVAFLCVIIC